MTKARDLANIISGGFTEADIPNLSASKITSGTFSDARISASNVSQHATSFDDNKIVNDISTLAIRQASNENKGAYNTNSMYVDVFQDSTGITNLTNASRTDEEYIASVYTQQSAFSSDSDTGILLHFDNNSTDSSSNSIGFSTNGSSGYTTSYKKFGTHSKVFDGSSDRLNNTHGSDGSIFHRGTGDFTIECWYYATTWANSLTLIRIDNNSSSNQQLLFGYMQASGTGFQNYISDDGGSWGVLSGQPTFTGASQNTWQHLALERHGNNFNFYLDGVKKDTDTSSASLSNQNYMRIGGDSHGYFQGYMDEVRYSTVARYQGNNFTPNSTTVTSATGSFESNTITAPSSVSKMGAIITYQNQAGTNALNTDVILKLSADGGSNYSTATLTAMPDFASGIKMAKVNDLSVTAGTSLKYKIEFANQASGSKEARIRGVSLQY
ncbi:putative lectin [uncultured Mediterranean phage uvMED]|nr:putative lectin [uncultured Mediterranean phage uvMED]